MRPIVQIVPQLPPHEEGVGGIAVALAEALRKRGVPSRFVVPVPYGGGAVAAGLDALEIPPEPEALAEAVGDGPALLHYVGYGYHPRGVPRWLSSGLARSSAPLWTQFHEVWATGPPWRSSFWLAPRQRGIVRDLGDRSDRLSTSLDLYAAMVRSALSDPRRGVAVQPVLSGVGEPASPPLPYGAREPRLLVFGGPGLRARAYGEEASTIERAARALGLREIWDVGPGPVAPAALGDLTVRRLGLLSAPDIGALFAGSAAGFLAYPLDLLGKSSAFAAYAAHGMLPVCSGRAARHGEAVRSGLRSGDPAGPTLGTHYWDPRSTSDSPRDPSAIAAAARSWYEGHSAARQAEAIASWAQGADRLRR